MQRTIAVLVAVLAVGAAGCARDRVGEAGSRIVHPATGSASMTRAELPAPDVVVQVTKPVKPAAPKQDYTEIESSLDEVDGDLADLDSGIREASQSQSENDIP